MNIRCRNASDDVFQIYAGLPPGVTYVDESKPIEDNHVMVEVIDDMQTTPLIPDPPRTIDSPSPDLVSVHKDKAPIVEEESREVLENEGSSANENNSIMWRISSIYVNTRHYGGEDQEPLSPRDLQNVEQQLETTLKLITTKKSLENLTIPRLSYGSSVILTSTWELTRLTTLHLEYIMFNDEVTAKDTGIFSKCANLKKLVLKDCSMIRSNGVNIFHPGLSNLTLVDGPFFQNVINVVTPQLKNLTVKNWPGLHLISAPELVSLRFEGLHSYGLCFLEKVDLCICKEHIYEPNKPDAHSSFDLLQQLHSINYLMLNVEMFQATVKQPVVGNMTKALYFQFTVGKHDVVDQEGTWKKKLKGQSHALFEILPKAIQEQLLIEIVPQGNVHLVAKIKTRKMLIQMVEADLEIRKKDGGKLVGSDELEFGLAPPVVKSPISLKLNSTTLSNGGNTIAIALQAVGGPYMWNPEWSSAVQRISQGTPPVGIFRNSWIVNNENFAYAAVRRGLHHHLQYRSGYLESQIEEYVKFVATSSTDTNSLDTKKNPKACLLCNFVGSQHGSKKEQLEEFLLPMNTSEALHQKTILFSYGFMQFLDIRCGPHYEKEQVMIVNSKQVVRLAAITQAYTQHVAEDAEGTDTDTQQSDPNTIYQELNQSVKNVEHFEGQSHGPTPNVGNIALDSMEIGEGNESVNEQQVDLDF
ncbi:F-box domain containing protein [Tanacetum coccineum]